MKRFTCPGCGEVVEAIGTEVMHPCPKRRNRLTFFTTETPEPETPTDPEATSDGMA